MPRKYPRIGESGGIKPYLCLTEVESQNNGHRGEQVIEWLEDDDMSTLEIAHKTGRDWRTVDDWRKRLIKEDTV